MCRSVAIRLLICLLSDLLPLNILNYSQPVDVFSKAIDVCVWPDAHQLHSCSMHCIFGGGAGFSLQVTIFIHITQLLVHKHVYSYILFHHLTTNTRHDVVAMHGYYHHATISQVHCITSLHLSAHRPPTSWCVGRMY